MSRERLWDVGSGRSIVVNIVVNFSENMQIDIANSPKRTMVML